MKCLYWGQRLSSAEGCCSGAGIPFDRRMCVEITTLSLSGKITSRGSVVGNPDDGRVAGRQLARISHEQEFMRGWRWEGRAEVGWSRGAVEKDTRILGLLKIAFEVVKERVAARGRCEFSSGVVEALDGRDFAAGSCWTSVSKFCALSPESGRQS